MEFYDAIARRRTIRDFKDEPIKEEIIRRILSAGLKAPSNDHMRDWEFVVITDREVIAKILKKIPKKVSDARIQFLFKSWKLEDPCQQRLYAQAVPKQYKMLYESGCLILPFFRQRSPLLAPKSLSSLNAFASIWCCIENIFLAATAEGLACSLRIPLDKEPEYIREVLGSPADYVMPCYISLGIPAEDACLPEQIERSIDEKIHMNNW